MAEPRTADVEKKTDPERKFNAADKKPMEGFMAGDTRKDETAGSTGSEQDTQKAAEEAD